MNILRSFWALRVSFYHSDHSISLTNRSNHLVTLPDLCKDSTPPYQPSIIAFNGHLQTIWTALRRTGVFVRDKRKMFKSEDDLYPGTFAVDFVSQDESETMEEDSSLPPHITYYGDHSAPFGSFDSKTMVIALHGVAGVSHERCIKHVLAPLVASGWEACVVVSRGCGGTDLTSPLLYNARSTWDLKQTVAFLRNRYPNRPLYAIGFSIGANILVNWEVWYLGEEGERCGIRAAVVCSNPLNLEVVVNALRRSWMGLNIYSNALGNGMKQTFQQQVIKLTIARDVRKITKLINKSVVQLPMWGYPTTGTYYRDASSVDAVLAVKVPLFALNAEDDPISHYEALPFEEFCINPYTVLCTTSSGGHLGWYESEDQRWFTKPVCVVTFLEALHREIDWSKDTKLAPNVSLATQSFEYNPIRRKIQPANTVHRSIQAKFPMTLQDFWWYS
ncbi:alpha/beta hydrolase fold family protein [Bipolaris maydis]|nr:alpha/beta hydrolase fold family protein [Bipolaris maydis]KAJ6194052.1 alpha/beta hydrolase fold family protein [Bipolaris maydis]KAJ6211807.1 alpha/beta hydrolase fold family protein [Bipolaris maydis]